MPNAPYSFRQRGLSIRSCFDTILRYGMRYDIGSAGVMVQIHDRSPSDEEWTRLLDYMEKNRQRIRYVMAISRGNGSPSSKQRERLAKTLESFPAQLPFALLTESRVARGVLTAMNWMTGRAKHTAVFAPNELEQALAFFQLSASDRQSTRDVVARLDATPPVAQGR